MFKFLTQVAATTALGAVLMSSAAPAVAGIAQIEDSTNARIGSLYCLPLDKALVNTPAEKLARALLGRKMMVGFFVRKPNTTYRTVSAYTMAYEVSGVSRSGRIFTAFPTDKVMDAFDSVEDSRPFSIGNIPFAYGETAGGLQRAGGGRLALTNEAGEPEIRAVCTLPDNTQNLESQQLEQLVKILVGILGAFRGRPGGLRRAY